MRSIAMVRGLFLAAFASALLAGTGFGQVERALDRDVVVREPNYDESKVGPYTLEDPLRFLDGRKVTAANWPERRKEILDIFSKEMYGAEPHAPEAVVTELAVRRAPLTLPIC